jgi:hypothetical protein
MSSKPIPPGTTVAASECERVAHIIKERSGTHGDAHANLEDIARRWSNYLNKVHQELSEGTSVRLSAADVAYMMVEMKLSRATYGDNAELDHPRDIIGYAAIWASYIALDKNKDALQKRIPAEEANTSREFRVMPDPSGVAGSREG